MPVYEIKRFDGGISDYANKGIPGAFKFGYNLDIRKVSDTLSCNQALAEEGLLSEIPSESASPSPSASVSASSSRSLSASPSPTASFSVSASRSPSASVSPSSSVSPSTSVSPSASPSAGLSSIFNDLVRFWVKSSTGFLYGFGSTGHIYRVDTDGHWKQVYKDADGAIKGAEEGYTSDGRVWAVWATDTKVKRKPLPGAANWNDVETVAGDLTSAEWHTMKQVRGSVQIANSSAIALLAYDGSYSNNVLNLIPGNIAKTIVERDGRSIIGTARASDPTKSINAAIDSEFPLAQIGDEGQVIFTNMVDTMPTKSFPGGGKVNPGGVCNEIDQVNMFEWEDTADSWLDKQSIGNMALFAVYGAENGKNGVYSYGRKDKNKQFVMNLEYQLEADELGAVVVFEGKLFVSYETDGEFGVKAVDSTTKATAVYEGLEWYGPVKGVSNILNWTKAEIICDPLPSGAALEFWYRLNATGSFLQAKMEGGSLQYTAVNGRNAVFFIAGAGEIYEPRVVLIPTGNESPQVRSIVSHFVSPN